MRHIDNILEEILRVREYSPLRLQIVLFIYLFIYFNENQVTSPFIKKYSVLVLLVLHPLPLDDEFLFIVSTKHERLIVLFSLFMSLLQLGVRLSVKSNKASL